MLAFTISGPVSAQFIHKIKADSVLLTYDQCNSELIIENSTRNIKGFLFNKGNGRTEFRRIFKLNDSTIVAGDDTITFRGIGNDWSIYGNDNSDTATDYLGTTDNNPLLIKTKNEERVRITEAGNVIVGRPAVDNGAKLQVAGNYAQSGNRIEFNNTTLGGSGNTFQINSNGNRYLKVSSGSLNTFAGFLSPVPANEGTINTGVGYNSMRSLQSSAFNNSAFGVNTLRGLTTGNHNLALGINAGLSLTTGVFNVLIGTGALFQLTTQNYNTIVGDSPMAGTNAGGGNDNGPIGSENIMFGQNAGGSGKTMAQWFAGGTTTYTKNIMIGRQNGKNTPGGTLSNTTLLGNTITTDLSNILVLGNSTQKIILGNSNSGFTDNNIKLQVESQFGYSGLQLSQSYTPASTSDTNGAVGVIAWDENYFYVRTAAGWKRTAISTY